MKTLYICQIQLQQQYDNYIARVRVHFLNIFPMLKTQNSLLIRAETIIGQKIGSFIVQKAGRSLMAGLSSVREENMFQIGAISDKSQFICLQQTMSTSTRDERFKAMKDSQNFGQYHSRIPVDGSTKQEIKEYFLLTWQLHEALFDILNCPEAFYLRPQPLRHPLIFYYGHTSSFYVNKMMDMGLISERVDPKMEAMMAVGVNEMKWDDLDESHYDWPTKQEVYEFRKKVNTKILQTIDKIEGSINWKSDMWIILMGIQHERIHMETSATIIRRLDPKYTQKSNIFIECPFYETAKCSIPENPMKKVPAARFNWPKQIQNANQYGWDNQFGLKEFKVREFKASQTLVSNGEFMGFVEDGGYNRPELWSQEGKEWLKTWKPSMPVFWKMVEGSYQLRTLTGQITLPVDWPVEVNQLEAAAFCTWKSSTLQKKVRLPTQSQLLSMRLNFLKKEHEGEWNKDMKYWSSPCPVNMFKFGDFYDITGNLWQLTNSDHILFEEFQAHPAYEDFTLPYSNDGLHIVMLGNCFLSTGAFGNHLTRNFFRRHFYQFSGFRYVEAYQGEQNSTFSPQQQALVNDKRVQLSFTEQFVKQPEYILETVKIIQGLKKPEFQQGKALVVGCSTGRLVLELAGLFGQSIGTDYIVRYFSLALKLIEKGTIQVNDKKFNISDFCECPDRVSYIQMNPENPDSKKINGCTFLILDGLNLKPNNLEKVMMQSQKMMHPSKPIHMLLISYKNRNQVNKERVKFLLPKSTLTYQNQTEQGKVCLALYEISA